MSRTRIETCRLILLLESLEETRERIDLMSEEDRVDLSAEWLSLLEAASTSDPWILGFNMVLGDSKEVIGQCGFKGPPSSEGIVEIAYFVEPGSRGKGFATESANALVEFAMEHDDVQRVLAHTLPESNASCRVLTKCGFTKLGPVIDPEDGPVWRWEKNRQAVR